MKFRDALLTVCLALGALPAAAQSDRTVALVVSVGDGSGRADALQGELQILGAETLRTDNPNNAELRSILRRFAREAVDARATFVYIDAPAVNFEGRAFVLPEGATLDRPTDLFTQAIPIHAFARSAAQSEQGGAVAMSTSATRQELPDGVEDMQSAPDPVPGSSPVLVAPSGAFAAILASFEQASRQDKVELGGLLRSMFLKDDVTLSHFPTVPAFLRQAPEPEVAPQTEQVSAAIPEAAVVPDLSEEAAPPAETLEELTLLEQSLSRSAKRSIQRELRDLGLYKGLVDGIFGPQTRQAITAFQQDRAEDQTGVLTRRQLLDLST